jgi:hypothetical protein
MRKFILLAIIAAMLALPATTVNAAPPPDGPPGLERAIAAQEAHNPQLLAIPGVVGTAVGLTADGQPAVKIYSETAGVRGLPAFLDGVPVVTQVTGKLFAMKPPTKPPKPDKPDSPGGNRRNKPPQVVIASPVNGTTFNIDEPIDFAATATDKEDGDLSNDLSWESDIQGPIGYGPSFTRTLANGEHIITASAIDSGSKVGSDSINITISEPGELETTDVWPGRVPIGISTGNAKSVSAGTIACRVKDTQGNVYALSNTHVYAPYAYTSQAAIGDEVMQPGRLDAPGQVYDPSLYLGTLVAYEPIDGSIFAVNEIDAAIALTTTDRLDNTTPLSLGGYGIPNSETVPVDQLFINMPVQKFGRTTQLTKGQIDGINATVMIEYAPGWYVFFYNQITVASTTAFILPGDSGSLMVTDDDVESYNPVGLLFAGNGSGTWAIANPIDLVLNEFGVTIDGK